MKKVNRKLMAARNGIIIFWVIYLFLGIYGCSSSSSTPPIGTRPVVFVHGYAGSADQFETQAMRLASNGYSAGYISGFEYNTLSVTGNPTTGFVIPPEILSGLDAYIDAVLKQTGADKVELLGHSMGTAVSHAYLADPAHAAKVAHYVNLDGQQSATPPGGVPTLAIFAELTGTGRSIGGATNITLANTTHVQAASCVESFVEIYKFFNNGMQPITTDILPGIGNKVELAGRILTFLTNTVPADLKLDIYEVNKDTGVRVKSIPDYSTSISADGNFKFTNATAGSNYEFHLTSPSDTTSVHYYYEPFIRSDYLVRLKYMAPAVIGALMDQSVNHSNLILIRNKEFLGVNSMYPNEDILRVNNTELCTGVLTKNGILGTPIALFIFDKGSDGVSDLSGPIASLSLPFIAGLDFYMKAANPPDSMVSIVLKGRYSEKIQVVNVPNWQSTTDYITVQMWDY